jgi:predicted regulator of Ras-like GTPase activity (Roadblock/LC7/MglB family)
MLVTEDGVPVAVPGVALGDLADPSGARKARETRSPIREDALAAIATGWLGELGQAVAPLSWDAPDRVVLEAARGTIVMQRVHSAVLIVLLARGVEPEDVRLSMYGTVARIERSIRSLADGAARRGDSASTAEPRPALPSSMTEVEIAHDLAEASDPREHDNSFE